jgi:hypothetical protein
MDHNLAAADVAGAVGLTEEQVKHVVRDFERKQAISARLMAPSILLGETAGTP